MQSWCKKLEAVDAKEKNLISFGKVIKKEDIYSIEFIPKQLISMLKKTDFYLIISIPNENQGKIFIFPLSSSNVKKILIQVDSFNPELIQEISKVLRSLNLNENLIHTNGLCFSESRGCYYETYAYFDSLEKNNITIEDVKKDFLQISKVKNVLILDMDFENYK